LAAALARCAVFAAHHAGAEAALVQAYTPNGEVVAMTATVNTRPH
jgi:hypothetical protein